MQKENTKRLDIRVKKTYRHLIDGMFTLLNRKAFEDITVLEICEASGVHRATFYKHFSDKYDFLTFCFESMFKELPFDKSPRDLTKEGAKQYYMDIVNDVVSFVEKNKQLFRNVSDVNQSQIFMSSLTDSVAALLEKRIHVKLEEGNSFSSPAPMLANFYAGALIGIIKWWVVNGDDYTIADLQKFASMRIDELLTYYAKKASLKQY